MAGEIYSLERMAPHQSGREAFIRYLMISKCVDVVVNRNTSYGYKLVEQWPLVSKQVRFADVLHLHAFGKDWVHTSAPYHEEIDLRYVTSDDLPGYAARQYNIKADRFQLLDYGFEPEELPDEKTCANRRHTIRERWKIPASAFVVGFVGRLTNQKDPQRWLSIAAEIARRRPGTLFLVVGGGELMDQAKATAAALGLSSNVVFTDYQRDAAYYCAAMDVLLMTSKYEGLPLLVLHALAHGTPIVSSDVGSIRSCVSGAAGRVLATGENDLVYAKAVLEVDRLRINDVSVGRHCRAVVSKRFVKQRMRQQLQHDFSCLTKALDREKRREDYQLDVMSRPILV
jgi:glycosyltransferase involved in cell wall biosynthesis